MFLKKILFCSSYTPPVNAGGGKNAFNFAKFLSEKGLNITLLTLNRRGKLPPREMAGSLKIVRILYFNYNLFTKLLSLLIILPGYFIYVLRNDVIFIYGGNIIAFEFIILTGRLLGRHVVFRSTMLGEDDMETLLDKGVLFKALRKKILGMISTYFSLNPEFTKSYLSVYSCKSKVFESTQGVNTEVFHTVDQEKKVQIRKKLGLPSGKFIIISVGFLIKRKGFRQIFEVLSKLNIPYLYLVVGDYKINESHYLFDHAHEMTELYNKGHELLKSKALFTGPKENVSEYLQASDIFLLNSRREGVPNSLLEAMACGIAPVIRNIKGVNGFLTFHDKNAFVYNTPEEFNDRILDSFKSKKRRLFYGRKSSELVNKDSTFEVLYEKLTRGN